MTMNTLKKRTGIKVTAFIVCFAVLVCSGAAAFMSQAANGERTVFYLNRGDVTIGNGTVSGFDIYGTEITTVNPSGYTITQANSSLEVTAHSITVTGGTNSVEIMDLNVNLSSSPFDGAFVVSGTAVTTLIISGVNTLTSGSARAGVQVGISSTLTIEGTGTLTASSASEAGIGGGNGNRNGTLIINSGTIIANGGTESHGAGIGGGSDGTGGSIEINGGNITANGGQCGAGIGGGNGKGSGTIVINGGNITAIGGLKAAGIGGGWFGAASSVTINGGNITTTGGTGGAGIGGGQSGSSTAITITGGTVKSTGITGYDIGAGSGGTTNSIVITGGSVNAPRMGATPIDAQATPASLLLTTVEFGADCANSEMTFTGLPANFGSDDIFADAAGKVYFYLPSATALSASAHISDDIGYTLSGNAGEVITASLIASQSAQVIPKDENSTAVIDDENGYIYGLIPGVSLSELTSTYLACNGGTIELVGSIIGTGSQINVVNSITGETDMTYTIIIFGDLTGDGLVTATDLSMIRSSLSGGSLLDSDVQYASDLQRDGLLTNSDYTSFKSVINSGKIINQVTGVIE